MSPSAPKPLFWFLEEATPEVAQLMHLLERSLGASGSVQRISYTEALKQLPRESTRAGLTAIITFSLPSLRAMAALLKGLKGTRPRLCFYPPTYESLSGLKPHQRWPVPVSAIARHAGEAALFVASGFKPECVVRLQVDIQQSWLPEGDRPAGRPLRVGFAWHNMAPASREALATEIARWQQRIPDRFEWHVGFLPGQRPPLDSLDGVVRTELTPQRLAETEAYPLDVHLYDPWWPDASPCPWRAPVQLALPPGGMTGEGWEERLQGLLDLGDQGTWEPAMLWAFCHQPIWRHLIKGEERPLAPLPEPDLAALSAERGHWQSWLTGERAAWPEEWDEAPDTTLLSFYFWIYDYRVQLSWCHDIWAHLAGAKNGERHALLLAFNALRLHHASSAWLFKRLLARTTLGRDSARKRRLGRKFWANFTFKHLPQLTRWVHTVASCGKDDASDPLGASRAVSASLLDAAKISVEWGNEPAPIAGVPTLYLMSHRHGELDPFLLLDTLPGQLAVVVGPRAQRWPLMHRLNNSTAFVLTGRERGVVIADAIAAVRSRRALALYPEVAEPTYLGEGTPLRSGLMWIVQALEHSQVIPVVLEDAFTLGPNGGAVRVWFGPPILCTPATCEGLLDRVRMFYHRHVGRMNELDAPPRGFEASAVVPAAPEPLPAEPAISDR